MAELNSFTSLPFPCPNTGSQVSYNPNISSAKKQKQKPESVGQFKLLSCGPGTLLTSALTGNGWSSAAHTDKDLL